MVIQQVLWLTLLKDFTRSKLIVSEEDILSLLCNELLANQLDIGNWYIQFDNNIDFFQVQKKQPRGKAKNSRPAKERENKKKGKLCSGQKKEEKPKEKKMKEKEQVCVSKLTV